MYVLHTFWLPYYTKEQNEENLKPLLDQGILDIEKNLISWSHNGSSIFVKQKIIYRQDTKSSFINVAPPVYIIPMLISTEWNLPDIALDALRHMHMEFFKSYCRMWENVVVNLHVTRRRGRCSMHFCQYVLSVRKNLL